MFVSIAINIPSEKTFTYSVPEYLKENVVIGKRVLVQFGKRKLTGYVLGFQEKAEREGIKQIIEVLDHEPLFNENDLKFYEWMSNYYMYPLGKTLNAILPGGINIESNLWIELLTDKEIQKEQTLSTIQKRIIEILNDYPHGLSIKNLTTEIRKKNIRNDLKKLQSSGFIDVCERLKKPQVKTKTERIICPVHKSLIPTIRLTKKQKEIIDYLLERGEVSISSLSKEFQNISSTIKSLKKKDLIRDFEREVYRNPPQSSYIGASNKINSLNVDQSNAIRLIVNSIISYTYSSFLLHGVTGSGKTEVYLNAIEETLKLNGSAIYLIPEISLTPQLLSRIKERFCENEIAIIHSGISRNSKYDEWRRIQKGTARIIIGARSAIFVPAKNLRLIIVDEEHETSYKQDERITYSARDLAVVRAKLNSATVVLGSATPAIQTYFNIGKKDFGYLHLPKRIDNKPLPKVDIVDMKAERNNSGAIPLISRLLKDAIEERLDSGEQTLLFLNRRGFNTFLCCLECGYIFKCLNCSVSMTYHSSDQAVKCHYCDYSIKAPPVCPSCKGTKIRNYGMGTEKVEDEIVKLFPTARVERMDSDTTIKKGSYDKILMALDKGDIDILIGTQMIAKGHDFRNIALVGVVSADTSLNLPDFRASEKTFQILTQVSGRGGRGNSSGKVIIQTFNPDHYALKLAKDHDFLGFYNHEIKIRKELCYPPFSRMVNLHISSSKLDKLQNFTKHIGSLARELSQGKNDLHNIIVLGPAEAPIAKIKGIYRWHMLLRGKSVRGLHELTKYLLSQIKKTDINIKVDIDPVNFL